MNMFLAMGLGRGENPRPNIAFPSKGEISRNRIRRIVRRAKFPMMKAILPEAHSPGASLTGRHLVLHRVSTMIIEMVYCLIMHSHCNQGIRYTHNVKNGTSKGNINAYR